MQAPDTYIASSTRFWRKTGFVFKELPKGTDFTPLLQGLNNDSLSLSSIGIYSRRCYGWSFYMMEKKITLKRGCLVLPSVIQRISLKGKMLNDWF